MQLPTRAIRAVAPCAAKVDERFALSCVKLEAAGDLTTVVATDGKVMAVATCRSAHDGTADLVPAAALLDACKGSKAPPTIAVDSAGPRLRITAGNRSLEVDAPSGRFPEWTAVVPSTTTAPVCVSASALIVALKAAMAMCDPRTDAPDRVEICFTAAPTGEAMLTKVITIRPSVCGPDIDSGFAVVMPLPSPKDRTQTLALAPLASPATSTALADELDNATRAIALARQAIADSLATARRMADSVGASCA